MALASPSVQRGPLFHLHLDLHLDCHLVVRGEGNTLIESSHSIFSFVKVQKYGSGSNHYLQGTMESEVGLLDLISQFVAKLLGH